MSATPHPPPLRELDHRQAGGIDVTLFWDRGHGHLLVCVCDASSGDYFAFRAECAEALDAFLHPFAYAARRGIQVSPAHRAATRSHLSRSRSN